jgi:hypothetical protein
MDGKEITGAVRVTRGNVSPSHLSVTMYVPAVGTQSPELLYDSSNHNYW